MSLHNRVFDWAIARDLIYPNGTPNQGTTEGQLAQFQEELLELQQAMLGSDTSAMQMENGDVQVTLILLAAMHSTSILHCVRAATASTLPANFLDRPKHWGNVDYWAQMLDMHQSPATIGAVWLCILNCATTQLGVHPERCLQMAVEKIEGRTEGEIVNGQWERVR